MSKTQQSIASALRERSVRIDTPFVEMYGISSKTEVSVEQIYEYFLRLDGKGSHFEDAKSWAQTRSDDSGFFFFQLMLLLCETQSEGCVMPIESMTTDLDAYKLTVHLSALVALTKATQAEAKELEGLVKHDFYFDSRFLLDVECEKERIRKDEAVVEDELPPMPQELKKIPKIKFTCTRLLKQDGINIAGLYCRFIVFDPTINPSAFFDRVVRNAKDRNRRTESFEEMFPLYSSLYLTNHPAGNDVSMQSYLTAATCLCPDLQNEMRLRGLPNIHIFESPFHLSKILSMSNAVAVMRKAGVAEEFCAFTWYNRNTKEAFFPSNATTFKYLPEQVFWYDPIWIGFSEHVFPHIVITTGVSLEKYLSATYMERNDEIDKFVENMFQKTRNVIPGEQFLVPRSQVRESHLVPYKTNNEFIHRAAEAAQIDKYIKAECPCYRDSETLDAVLALKEKYGDDEWRSYVSKNLKKKIDECERYNDIRKKSQLVFMEEFARLWPVEGGNVQDLPIPDTIKAMLEWYQKNENRFPSLTRQFTMWDPNLSLFGNSMLRQLKMYSCVAQVLQPIICLLGEGLFSCYHYAPRQLTFNMLLHGQYDTGKSFAGITTLIKYTTIPNTVKQYTVSTPAADTTLKHDYDLILACDEAMPYMVNEKEAKKNPILVNKEKVKMTDGQIGLQTFCYVKTPDGQRHRWSETITTDHHVSRIAITNAAVEPMNALASRYFRMTVSPPRISPTEVMGPFNGESIKSSTIDYLHINQYLSACANKAAMCGAMLAEPEMQLFDDLSNKVLDYLTDHNLVRSDCGSRGLEIMKPYARQLIYHMAIHYTFDLPSSPHFQKKFSPYMIRDMQPYLYCTTDIVWWCWTALGSYWIDEKYSNVIQAMRKVAGITNWRNDMSTFDLYKQDKDKTIQWKRTSDKLLDLTFVQIQGTSFDDICNQIVTFTDPKLTRVDVEGIVKALEIHSVSVKAHLPQSTDKLNDPQFEPQFRESTNCCIVEICKKNILNFMPGMDVLFYSSQILEALSCATVCWSIRPGKILLGSPESHDPTMLQLFNTPAKWIQESVTHYDEKNNLFLLSNGKLEWRGNPEWEEDERPVSRRVGISFNRKGSMTSFDAKFFTTMPPAPVGDDDNGKWKLAAVSDVKRMSAVCEVYADLDFESAKRQHMACGRSFDEPIASPQWLEEQYKNVCVDTNRPWHEGMDYPHGSLVEMDEREAIFEARSKIPSRADAKIMREKVSLSNLPRTEELREEMAKIQDKKKKKNRSKRDRDASADIIALQNEEPSKQIKN